MGQPCNQRKLESLWLFTVHHVFIFRLASMKALKNWKKIWICAFKMPKFTMSPTQCFTRYSINCPKFCLKIKLEMLSCLANNKCNNNSEVYILSTLVIENCYSVHCSSVLPPLLPSIVYSPTQFLTLILFYRMLRECKNTWRKRK